MAVAFLLWGAAATAAVAFSHRGAVATTFLLHAATAAVAFLLRPATMVVFSVWAAVSFLVQAVDAGGGALAGVVVSGRRQWSRCQRRQIYGWVLAAE
uniref:Uncharacterized protein n=1 Tax=Oryza brachyantha TaxID=4533 RepID=J3N7H2_ORYBR